MSIVPTNEGADVNEAASLSGLEPLIGKGMRRKHKGKQLVHPFTPLEPYKRRKVGDGYSVKDFIILPEPMQIIPKPNMKVFVDVLTRSVAIQTIEYELNVYISLTTCPFFSVPVINWTYWDWLLWVEIFLPHSSSPRVL